MHKIVSSETEKAYHATNCKRQKIFKTKYFSIYFFPLMVKHEEGYNKMDNLGKCFSFGIWYSYSTETM